MNHERLTQRLAHRHPRVERAVRILEHDLHAAAQRSQLPRAAGEHVDAVEYDAAGVGLDQSEDRATHRGLPAPRFPDEAQGAAGRDAERDAVHRPHWTPPARERPRPAVAGKMLHEPVHLDERRDGRHAWGVRRLGSVRSQHRTAWLPGSPRPASSSGGSSTVQRSHAYGQRGWNRQPAGHALAAGTWPGMVCKRPRTWLTRVSIRGTAAISPSVYGWSGCANSSGVAAVSTTWPAYITTTRSDVPATIPRSCVISRTAMPSSACRRSSSSRI